MDTMQILKRAWSLAWRYRVLWLFGFLLALTVNNALWLGFTGRDQVPMENRIIMLVSTVRFPGEGVTIDLRHPGGAVVDIEGVEPGWLRDLMQDVRLSDIGALLISIGIVALIGTLLAILLRYTSQAALIRMVDEHERSGDMVGIRRGLRLGWSRVAGKLFLIDLFLALAAILVLGLLFALAASPFFLLGMESVTESVVRIVGIALLGLAGLSLFFVLALAAAALFSITKPVMHQACAVDGLGVTASIRQGFRLLKTCTARVLSTWLVWLAVRLAWMIAIIPAVIILSPVLLLSMGIGIVVAAVPTLLAAGIASQFVSPLIAWLIGAVFGLPLFTLVTFSPIFFLSGLLEVFKSSFWMLSYREFRPLASIAPQPVNKSEPAGLRVAPAA